MKNSDNDKIELGKIVGVWGIQGWVKVHSYTRNRQDVGQYSNWLLTNGSKSTGKESRSRSAVSIASDKVHTVEQCRLQGQSVVAKLAGIDDRNVAQTLIGQKIFIDASQLAPLPENEFYWFQLIGLNVVTVDGHELGVVDSMLETGANDVFVVKQTQDGAVVERLIPYIDSVVADIDIQSKSLTVDWDKDYLVAE